jgi:hypothetical protein
MHSYFFLKTNESTISNVSMHLQVCLVNTGLGTPFISGLELRPLSATMYQEATATQSLFLLSMSRPSARFYFNRYQFKPDNSFPPFR